MKSLRASVRLVLSSVLVVYASAQLCEPWCEVPCSELNGDVAYECGACDATLTCNPAASDFSPRGSLAPLEQEPQNPAASTGFGKKGSCHGRMEDIDGEDAPYLGEADPALRADCESEACIRANERLLRRVAREASARRHGVDEITLGGRPLICELQQISADELLKLPPSKRAALLDEPTVVTGLLRGWEALTRWPDPFNFSAQFGQHTLLAKRSGFGLRRAQATAGASVETASVTVAEVVRHATTARTVVRDEEGMSRGEAVLLDALAKAHELPEVLEGVSLRRVFR